MSAAGLGRDWGAGKGGSGVFVWAAAACPISSPAARMIVRFISPRFLMLADGPAVAIALVAESLTGRTAFRHRPPGPRMSPVQMYAASAEAAHVVLHPQRQVVTPLAPRRQVDGEHRPAGNKGPGDTSPAPTTLPGRAAWPRSAGRRSAGDLHPVPEGGH